MVHPIRTLPREDDGWRNETITRGIILHRVCGSRWWVVKWYERLLQSRSEAFLTMRCSAVGAPQQPGVHAAHDAYRTLWNTRQVLHYADVHSETGSASWCLTRTSATTSVGGIWIGWSTQSGDVAVRPRRPRALANFVAHLPASPSGLALQAGDDIPRLADVLESLEEGLTPTRCNLDDGVHGWPPVALLRRFVRPDGAQPPA